MQDNRTKRKKIVESRYCVVCTNLIIRNTAKGTNRISPKQYAKAKFCSLNCKYKNQSENMNGSNNFNYKNSSDKCTTCSKDLLSYNKKNSKCMDCYRANNKGQNSVNWKGLTVMNTKINKMMPSCINCNDACSDSSSIICRKCYRGAFSSRWKGGISSLNSTIRASKENNKWRKSVMFRDNFKCTECHSQKQLQAHHIKPFSVIIKNNNIKSIEDAVKCDELWNIDNGVTLCIDCHKLTESYANSNINK